MDLTQAHAIVDDIEMTISQQLQINLTVHIDPISSDSYLTETIKHQISELIQRNKHDITLINYRCIMGNLRTTVMADILVSDSNRDQIKTSISQLKKELALSHPSTLLDVQLIES